MTRENVLENLKELVETVFDENEIICAFEDFKEEGETKVIVKDSENSGYDKIAYINSINSTQFLFLTHVEDEEEIIDDVWIA